MSFLIPPGPQQALPVNTKFSPMDSPGNLASRASSVMSDQVEAEPITRVMGVLELLMGESTDNDIRHKANQWLIEFQKSKETHRLVMEILYAALLPSRLDPSLASASNSSVPSPSPSTLDAIGHAQPAAQHQLLFFVAQTLNAKLRRAIGRVPRDTTHEEATQEIYCKPTELLIMARRSLNLPSGPHDALGKNLALAVGQMCILDLERSQGSLPEVHEVLRQCHLALKSNGDQFTRASTLLEHLDPQQKASFDDVTNLISERSTDATFAIEIFRALALGANQIVRARGLPDAVSVAVRTILVEIALAIMQVQRDSILKFIETQRRVFILLQKALIEATSTQTPVQQNVQEIAGVAAQQLQAALQTFVDLGELLRDVLESFNELAVKNPLPSDDVAVSNLIHPVMHLTLGLLSSLMTNVEESSLCAVVAAADEDRMRDLCDVVRQATVSAVDQASNFCKRARLLSERLSKGSTRQARRASDFAVAALNAMPQNQIELIQGAIRAADTALGFAGAVTQASQHFNIPQLYEWNKHRLQLVRSCCWLFLDRVGEEDDPPLAVDAAGKNRLLQCQEEVASRAHDSENTVGHFWKGNEVDWKPLPRQTDETWSSNTPNEILPERVRLGGRRRGNKEMEDVLEDNPDEDTLWEAELTTIIHTKRALLLEEAIGGFVLGQVHCLFASLTKSLASPLTAAILFGVTSGASSSMLFPSQIPHGIPCTYDPRVLVAWIMAVGVDLSVRPQSIVEALKSEPCAFQNISADLLYRLLDIINLLALSQHSLTIPQNGSLQDVFSHLLAGKVRQPGDMIQHDLVVLPYHGAYYDEPRGKASQIEALHRLVDSIDKYWSLTKPLRNELGLTDTQLYAYTWITWVLSQTVACLIYPINYERSSATNKNEIVSFREDLRKLSKALCRAVPFNLDKLFSILSECLTRDSTTDTSIRDWRQALRACQQWKIYDAALIVLTNVAKIDPHRSVAVLSNRILLERALAHRAVLSSTLWFLSALLPLKTGDDARVAIASLQLCRASLRAPQFDSSFPMTSREDHTGAIVLSSLSISIEAALSNDISCSAVKDFFDEIVRPSARGDSLFLGLATDIMWLTEQTLQRSTRMPAPEYINTYCLVSAATLPILYFSLGQITSCLRCTSDAAMVVAANQVESYVLESLLRILQLFGPRAESVKNAETRGITSKTLASVIDSTSAYILASLPPGHRPFTQRVHTTGVMRLPANMVATWGTEHQMVCKTLSTPLPERQHRGLVMETRRAIRVDAVKLLIQDQAQMVYQQSLLKYIIDKWGPLRSSICTCTLALDSPLPVIALSDLQATVMGLPASQMNGCHPLIIDTYAVMREHINFVPLTTAVTSLLATSTLHLMSGVSVSLQTLDQHLEEVIAWIIEGLARNPTEPSEALQLQSESILANLLARESMAYYIPSIPSTARPLVQVAICLAIVSILTSTVRMIVAVPTAEVAVPAAAGQLIRLATSPNPSSFYAQIREELCNPLLGEQSSLPLQIRKVLQSVLESLLVKLVSVAAIRGAARQRDSASSSPRGSISTPGILSPATPVESLNVPQVSLLSWILLSLLVEQTGMFVCPSVTQKDLGTAQNSLIELMLAYPIDMIGDHLESAQNVLLCIAVNNKADPLPTSPFLWSSSPTSVTQLRMDLTKFVNSKEKELKEANDVVATNDKPLQPGTTSVNWYNLTMPLRRLLKRSTVLINVTKRRTKPA